MGSGFGVFIGAIGQPLMPRSAFDPTNLPTLAGSVPLPRPHEPSRNLKNYTRRFSPNCQ